MGRRTARRTADAGVAVGYIRASRDSQKLTPAVQANMVETYARDHGLTLVCVCLDLGVCSADEAGDRPGLSLALDVMRDHGAGVLVVAKRDRLGRDVYVVASVERTLGQGGAIVASAAGEGNGSTPADAFMRTVVDGAAQYERALIRSRTKAALAVIRARGQKTGGGVPYGYTLGSDGRTLVAVESEQVVIRQAKALRAMGLSFAKVASMLADAGHISRTGKRFADMQVSRMTA